MSKELYNKGNTFFSEVNLPKTFFIPRGLEKIPAHLVHFSWAPKFSNLLVVA
jgi:hypothetical protein